jgi:hypothetical protein
MFEEPETWPRAAGKRGCRGAAHRGRTVAPSTRTRCPYPLTPVPGSVLPYPNHRFMPISFPSTALPEQHVMAVDPAAHAMAGNGGKRLRVGNRQIPCFGALDDRLAQRVLGTALKRSRETQDIRLAVARRHDHVGERRFAFGDRARLVENDGLEMFPRPATRPRSVSKIPFSAPLPMPTVSEVGVASPSPQGHAR